VRPFWIREGRVVGIIDAEASAPHKFTPECVGAILHACAQLARMHLLQKI
jgi:putative methionine-R-sulfoxide reductase with GAF domain